MVAVITTGYSIRRHFTYNENKVEAKLAECIGAGNYPVDVDKMTRTMKLNRLLKRKSLNDNVKRHSIHLSLNFSPDDVGLTKDRLLQIADDYMLKIGFEGQPYLVYRHHDAGHPHIHLVSLTIRRDGSTIDTHYIGSRRSKKACMDIERSYGLIIATERKNEQTHKLKQLSAKKIIYGRTETKSAISNVLNVVLDYYRYASLYELNAILRLYNVKADRCGKNSRTYQKGLVYKILDENGKPTGIPIAASSFYRSPTLKFLEKNFKSHTIKPAACKLRITNAIEAALLAKKNSMQAFTKALEKSGIHTVFKKDKRGNICGIVYVDHQTKCAFDGSTLGKHYSIKVIQARWVLKKTCKLRPLSYPVQTKCTETRPQEWPVIEIKTLPLHSMLLS